MTRPLVLVDATPLQSEHRLRGVGTYVRHLADALLELAPDEVRFVAEARTAHLLPGPVRERAVLGLRPHRPAQLYWMANEWFLRRAILRVRPAVFHATDFNGLVTVPGVRTVATLHDLTPLRDTDTRHSGMSERLSDLRWRVYYHAKIPRADHIIAVSENSRQEAVLRLRIPANRITVVHHGVDLDRFRPLRGHGPYARQPPYFLFVGSGEAHKNFTRVAEAFTGLATERPDISLYATGHGASVLSDPGLKPSIRFLGFIPDADMPSLYSNALALVFPSIDEGFGLPILESMACGTPVITSDAGAVLEVGGSACLSVNPRDASAIRRAMQTIIAKPEVRHALAAKGLQRAAQFTWAAAALLTLAVYRTGTIAEAQL